MHGTPLFSQPASAAALCRCALARCPAGPALPDTHLRIVDPTDPACELPDGQQGLILAQGGAGMGAGAVHQAGLAAGDGGQLASLAVGWLAG